MDNKPLIEKLRAKISEIVVSLKYSIDFDSDINDQVLNGDIDEKINLLIGLFGKGTYNKIKEISDLEYKKIEIARELQKKLNEVDSEIKRLMNLGEAEQKASKAFGKEINLK